MGVQCIMLYCCIYVSVVFIGKLRGRLHGKFQRVLKTKKRDYMGIIPG